MKLKCFLLLIIFVCQKSQIFSSVPDTLIYVNDLSFSGTQEKEAFFEISAKKEYSVFLELLLASHDKQNSFNRAEINQKIDNCVNYLRKEIENKSEVKKVKYTYDYVHKIFFKVYKLKNKFSDIFEKGEYNCVSATALYALIFSKLNISYQIKELPDHVYLIAYPNSAKVMIETTAPDKGYYSVNDDFQKKYLKHLYDSKTISKEEYDTTETNALFNKYGFSSENISLTELIGVQHSNYGLYESDNKNYNTAISEFKKAYFLYPCERHKYSLKLLLAYQIENNNYNDTSLLNNLLILCRYNNLKDAEISNESIKGEFQRILNIELINNSNFEKFEKSYTAIYDELTDSILKNEISFTYHAELARLGSLSQKGKEFELMHLHAAYQINPNNANLRSLILVNLRNSIYGNAEPKTALGIMQEYEGKFEFVNENNDFISIKANCMLELAYQKFYLNELPEGEVFLKDFEKLCKQKKDFTATPIFVEKAYAAAASAYYKRGNLTKSKQFLKTGLLYAPDNFGLKQRLSQFN